MNLWIIYKEGMVISRIIAEMLQNRLENYINVSVGNANKVEPYILLEEELDYLIIGDVIGETIPSMEIQNWVLKYREVSKKNNLTVKELSGFYITLTDIKNDKIWVEFLQENINSEKFYLPILRLQLNDADLADLNRVLESVKDYSNDFIEFLLNE